MQPVRIVVAGGVLPKNISRNTFHWRLVEIHYVDRTCACAGNFWSRTHIYRPGAKYEHFQTGGSPSHDTWGQTGRIPPSFQWEGALTSLPARRTGQEGGPLRPTTHPQPMYWNITIIGVDSGYLALIFTFYHRRLTVVLFKSAITTRMRALYK